jgi:hypothetical protein
MAGAPLGNRNGAKEKPWLAALNRALAKRSLASQKEALDDLADKLLDSCADGNLSALQELGNRLDGKPAQSVTVAGDPEAPLVHKIERSIVRSNTKD